MKHLIKAGLTGGVDIIASYFAWMIRYSKHKEKHPYAKRNKKVIRLCKHVLKSFSTDWIVFGKENIPDTTCCFFPNHQSSMDALLLLSTIDNQTTFVAKKELEKAPFIGRITKALDCEFMDRDDLRQSLKVMDRVSKDLQEGKRNWIIFPEGTRNKEIIAPLKEFHHGSFKAAMKAKVPIVPVAVYGTSRVAKVSPEFKKYPLHVSYLKPIMPSEYEGKNTKEIAQMVQEMVEREVAFHLRPLDHAYMCKLKSKKYRSNLIY